MAGNASLSIALLVLPDKSQTWLFDFACCNHMTPHSSLFSKLDPTPHPLNIHIADGSTMHENSLDFVSTSNLSVPGVFYVLDLFYNLCSVGQLAELGYRLIFDYSGCIVFHKSKEYTSVLLYRRHMCAVQVKCSTSTSVLYK